MAGETTPDISAMIKGIMGNPEFASLVKELKGDDGKNGGDVQGEIMDKLPEILSMLSPMMSGAKEQSEPSKSQANSPTVPLLPKSIEKHDKAKAERLMTAIKPYLSPERCAIIDKCMSVMQIGDIMNVLGGLNSLGLNGK